MASMNCHYYSFLLKHTVDINIIIPTPEGNEQINSVASKKKYPYEKGLPVVYLLHGAYGDYSSWLRFSNIERYAQQYGCAVVMASANNSFYQDMKHGNAYYSFFTKELVEFVNALFPISKRREDTYIAGLSMGGYGAWYLALSNPQLYAKAASMSGALDIVQLYEESKKGTIDGPFNWQDIFEEPQSLEGSSADLFELYSRCAALGNIPQLYQACGTEDFLYRMNLSVKERLENMDADFIYEEGPGYHDWNFWDQYIQKVLCWMMG